MNGFPSQYEVRQGTLVKIHGVTFRVDLTETTEFRGTRLEARLTVVQNSEEDAIALMVSDFFWHRRGNEVWTFSVDSFIFCANMIQPKIFLTPRMSIVEQD